MADIKTKNKKVGRPTKYTPEMCDKVDEFLEEMEDKEVQDLVQMSSKGSESYKRRVIVKLPTLKKFARFVGVNKDTLYEWARVHPEFSDSLEKINEKQEEKLLESGLSGEYNPTIAKLVLSSNHGYKEKSDLTTGDRPIPLLGVLTGEKNVSNNNSDKKDSKSN